MARQDLRGKAELLPEVAYRQGRGPDTSGPPNIPVDLHAEIYFTIVPKLEIHPPLAVRSVTHAGIRARSVAWQNADHRFAPAGAARTWDKSRGLIDGIVGRRVASATESPNDGRHTTRHAASAAGRVGIGARH